MYELTQFGDCNNNSSSKMTNNMTLLLVVVVFVMHNLHSLVKWNHSYVPHNLNINVLILNNVRKFMLPQSSQRLYRIYFFGLLFRCNLIHTWKILFIQHEQANLFEISWHHIVSFHNFFFGDATTYAYGNEFIALISILLFGYICFILFSSLLCDRICIIFYRRNCC